jgi:hypothetical protein
MNTPSPPAAPDPKVTATAQTTMNQNTATTQQLLNMTNQVTPDGTLTYSKTGENSFTDSDGKSYKVPQFTATQTLSPQGQQLKAVNDATRLNIGTIGRDQSQRIGNLLSKPVDLSNEATEARLFGLATKRLNPQFARDEEALRTRLSNSGIKAGSAAWDAEMGKFGERKNDAVNQLLLAGRGQAAQEALTERNQPINEITALLSGSQVSQPQFTATPQTGVAGVDYAGLVRDKYNADMNAYNQKINSNNAMMGGLFGLGGSLAKVFWPTGL